MKFNQMMNSDGMKINTNINLTLKLRLQIIVYCLLTYVKLDWNVVIPFQIFKSIVYVYSMANKNVLAHWLRTSLLLKWSDWDIPMHMDFFLARIAHW